MRYLLIKTCDVDLWGVPSEQRIARILSKLGVHERVESVESIVFNEQILILRADYLYDEAALRRLITRKNLLLSSSADTFPVAAVVEGRLVEKVASCLNAESEVPHAGLLKITPAELSGGYQARLRKLEQTHVLKIASSRQKQLENYLYDRSYKGITDLVTKWAWPIPARGGVRFCVRMHLTPNVITSFGLLLTILAGYLFLQGLYWEGLIAGWIMTFLDTVDGKLARVTLRSSKVGHVMDHGLDIIHPPIWYALWAYGLGVPAISLFEVNWPIDTLVWILFGAYIAGRLFEGFFQLCFNDLSIFCWRKLDSYHRLITARRNPCLIILTVALAFGYPQYGFMAVLGWTLLSSAFLFYRFAAGCISRLQSGPLHSWIEEVHPLNVHATMTSRLFAGAKLDTKLLQYDAY